MYEKFSFQNKGLLKKDTAETYEKHVQIIKLIMLQWKDLVRHLQL